MKKLLLALPLVLILFTEQVFSQTSIGTDSRTQIKVFEYYKHTTSEWLKLFRIPDDGWERGGVSGFVYFVDYAGEGGGMAQFVIPQRISSTQKPTINLFGNAADDFSWHVYQNLDSNGKNGYDVYIITPNYHVGFTFMLRGFAYTPYFFVESPGSNQVWSSTGNPETITFFKGNGSVGIGTLTPDEAYTLSVNGKIRAKEIKVETGWADFVFKDDYVLRPLAEVEQYIQQKGHLPDIPSEAEVLANGIELGAMDAKLLQKIEELTLYTIEQEKELEAHQNQLKLKSQRIDELESRLLQLEEIVRSLSKEK